MTLAKKEKKKMDTSLPFYSGPADHLRYGFRSLQAEHNESHPVERMQNSSHDSEWAVKLDSIRRMYGSALAMRMATERKLCSRPHRLPGLKSSTIHFDVVSGEDQSITFSDFLNGKCSP